MVDGFSDWVDTMQSQGSSRERCRVMGEVMREFEGGDLAVRRWNLPCCMLLFLVT